MATGTYVTAAGLTIPTITELVDRMSSGIRSQPGLALANTEPDGPVGPIIGIVADVARQAWEVVEISYSGINPTVGEGAQLEGTCEITGTKRASATSSYFRGAHGLVVNLDDGTPVPVGTRFTNAAGTVVFEATQGADEPAGVAVTADAGDDDYLCEAQCVELGPIAANAHTINVVVTNVSGLNSVDNPFKATKGTNEDNDTTLRQRRVDELAHGGGDTPDAIRADLLAFENDAGDQPIKVVTVYENTSNVFAANLPPHSFECVVYDDGTVDVDTIAKIIWDNRPGGMQPYGNTFGTVVGGDGKSHLVYFSRPTQLDFEFAISINVNPLLYPGDTAFKTAISARFLLKVSVGSVIESDDYVAAAMFVPGVTKVTNIQIGLFGGPDGADEESYQLGTREMGLLQANHVTVTKTEI